MTKGEKKDKVKMWSEMRMRLSCMRPSWQQRENVAKEIAEMEQKLGMI